MVETIIFPGAILTLVLLTVLVGGMGLVLMAVGVVVMIKKRTALVICLGITLILAGLVAFAVVGVLLMTWVVSATGGGGVVGGVYGSGESPCSTSAVCAGEVYPRPWGGTEHA